MTSEPRDQEESRTEMDRHHDAGASVEADVPTAEEGDRRHGDARDAVEGAIGSARLQDPTTVEDAAPTTEIQEPG